MYGKVRITRMSRDVECVPDSIVAGPATEFVVASAFAPAGAWLGGTLEPAARRR